MGFRRASVALLAATLGVAIGGLGSGIANAIKAAPALDLRSEAPTRRRQSRGGLMWSYRRHGQRGWSVAEGERRARRQRNRQRHKQQARG